MRTSFPAPVAAKATILSLCTLVGCATVQSSTRGSAEEAATLDLSHARIGELPALPESLRTAPEASPRRVTYRVCVPASSARALSVARILGDEAADATLLPALRSAAWELRGPTQGDGPHCFLESLESAADGTWKTAAQPYLLAGPERIEQSSDAAPQLPQEALQRLVGKDVMGLYRMCTAPQSGAVASAAPVVGVPGADREIVTALQTWRYKPAPTETCWIEPLRFSLTAAPSDPRQQDLSKQPREMGKLIR